MVVNFPSQIDDSLEGWRAHLRAFFGVMKDMGPVQALVAWIASQGTEVTLDDVETLDGVESLDEMVLAVDTKAFYWFQISLVGKSKRMFNSAVRASFIEAVRMVDDMLTANTPAAGA